MLNEDGIKAKDIYGIALAGFFVVMLIVGTIWGIAALIQEYNVWSASKDGQAQLAQADWNRQIAVREADAKMQAASELAQADVIRAQGVAKANQIIGQSLNNNESYLTWLFINNLTETKNQVIYVPTEGSLPILEAGKR